MFVGVIQAEMQSVLPAQAKSLPAAFPFFYLILHPIGLLKIILKLNLNTKFVILMMGTQNTAKLL